MNNQDRRRIAVGCLVWVVMIAVSWALLLAVVWSIARVVKGA